jgi:hypothetical protein
MQNVVSPWHPLGLRWNPFGEPPPEDVAALIVSSESLVVADWLRGPRRVQQYLGEAGRGKTARLRWLSARFPDAPYVYIAEGELPPMILEQPLMPAPLALLLDEAQRLAPRLRRRLFASIARQGGSLAVASHVDLSAELQGAGLCCRTCGVHGLDAHGLLAIVQRRLDWARLPGRAPAVITRAHAERLIERFGDNLRAILDNLYEGYQLAATHQETRPWQLAN